MKQRNEIFKTRFWMPVTPSTSISSEPTSAWLPQESSMTGRQILLKIRLIVFQCGATTLRRMSISRITHTPQNDYHQAEWQYNAGDNWAFSKITLSRMKLRRIIPNIMALWVITLNRKILRRMAIFRMTICGMKVCRMAICRMTICRMTICRMTICRMTFSWVIPIL